MALLFSDAFYKNTFLIDNDSAEIVNLSIDIYGKNESKGPPKYFGGPKLSSDRYIIKR